MGIKKAQINEEKCHISNRGRIKISKKKQQTEQK